MDSIDTILDDYVQAPSGLVSGEAMVWNGTSWVRSSVTRINTIRPQDLGQDGATSGQYLKWNGSSWVPATVTPGAIVQLYDSGFLGGASASFDVTTGLTGYNTLKFHAYLRGDTAATVVSTYVRINSDTGANYDYASGIGYGAWGTTGGTTTGTTQIDMGQSTASTATANRFSAFEGDIPMYAGTANHKTLIVRGGRTNISVANELTVSWATGVWRSTSAVTGIKIYPSAGNWAAGSRLIIYGLT